MVRNHSGGFPVAFIILFTSDGVTQTPNEVQQRPHRRQEESIVRIMDGFVFKRHDFPVMISIYLKKLGPPNSIMKADTNPHTPQADEYLETMARFRENRKDATVSALAEELKISKASVSEMLKKMEERELVKHSRYGTPELTKKGETRGTALLRKHRLLHRFLEIIGIRKTKIHEEACILEHAISDDVEKHMRMMVENGARLTHLNEGQHAEIVSIIAGDKCSQRLADLGLTKGTDVKILKSAPLHGPVTLLVRGTTLAIGNGIASKIIVKVK